MIPLKTDPTTGISSARQRELIAQVDAERAASAAVEPAPQEEWARAVAPEAEWKASPGIEVMNRWFPSSDTLTRERPPAPREKVTMAQAREKRIKMFGRASWLMPWQKREFAELYQVVDAPTEPLPIPEYVGHHDAIIASRKAATLKKRDPIPLKVEPKPRQGATFFTAARRVG